MRILVFVDGRLVPEKDVITEHESGFYSGDIIVVSLHSSESPEIIEALLYNTDGLLKARCSWSPLKSKPSKAMDKIRTLYKLEGY